MSLISQSLFYPNDRRCLNRWIQAPTVSISVLFAIFSEASVRKLPVLSTDAYYFATSRAWWATCFRWVGDCQMNSPDLSMPGNLESQTHVFSVFTRCTPDKFQECRIETGDCWKSATPSYLSDRLIGCDQHTLYIIYTFLQQKLVKSTPISLFTECICIIRMEMTWLMSGYITKSRVLTKEHLIYFSQNRSRP